MRRSSAYRRAWPISRAPSSRPGTASSPGAAVPRSRASRPIPLPHPFISRRRRREAGTFTTGLTCADRAVFRAGMYQMVQGNSRREHSGWPAADGEKPCRNFTVVIHAGS